MNTDKKEIMKKYLRVKERSKTTIRSILSLKALVGLLIFNSLSLSAQTTPAKTVSLFDGKTLSGWKTVAAEDKALWSVKDSVIICGNLVDKIKSNTYLQTENEYQDFEFRCLFRLTGDPATGMINSGIQYRSTVVNGLIVGYQADIGEGYWGDLYDEHRRGKLVGGDLSTLSHILNKDGWNSYTIRVKGNHHELYINGVKTADYIETDPAVPSKGVIAVQIHEGGAGQVEFRDLTISEL